MGTSSSSSSSEESEVRLASLNSLASSSDIISSSLSLDDSVQVDGSYSCFKGEEDRRLFFHPGSAGVKLGVFVPFKVTGVAGLGDRCGGGGGGASSSSSGSVLADWLVFGGAEAGGSGMSAAFAASRNGVEG